eukprot:2797694-Amphidinium_carterae.1
MAHGGPTGDPRVTAHLSTVPVCPTAAGWSQGEQHCACFDADYKVRWDSALHLCEGVAPDFQGLEAGLATQALRQLKLDGQSQKDNVKMALSAALGSGMKLVSMLRLVLAIFSARCGEALEDLEHIVHHCPAWSAKRREVGIPASALEPPHVLSCM